MKYHDVSDDINQMQIQKERETYWANIIIKLESNDFTDSLTNEELSRVLHQIQEYVLLDFPEKKVITQGQLRLALDSMTRVAIALQREDRDSNRNYISKKLYVALKNLEPQHDKLAPR